MRKTTVIVVAFMALALVQQAQAQGLTGIRLGYLDPKGAKPGLMLGLDVTSQMDQSLELGASVGAFRRNYVKNTEIAKTVNSSGVVETTVQRELEFTTFFIPIMAEAIIHLGQQRSHWFVNGGLGYEFLWNKENNLQEGTNERRYYHGFAWSVGGGYHFALGFRSALIAEVFYHNAQVKRNESKNAQGLPVWNQVDLSGLGFRAGLRFGLR